MAEVMAAEATEAAELVAQKVVERAVELAAAAAKGAMMLLDGLGHA